MRQTREKPARQAELDLELSSGRLSILIVFMILVGIALLYAWPTETAYAKSEPASVAILKEGQWVSLSGRIQSVDARVGGASMQVCDESAHCVRAFSSDSKIGSVNLASLEKGQELQVWGEVAVSNGGTHFLRVHRFALEPSTTSS